MNLISEAVKLHASFRLLRDVLVYHPMHIRTRGASRMASASQTKGKGKAVEKGEGEVGSNVSYASYITRPALPSADTAPPSSRPTTSASSERSKAKPPNSSRRLYVGNLHPAVDEYLLASTFAKYGKIAKLDFLFHKTGPMKGKPRGYAFVEYEKVEVSHSI